MISTNRHLLKLNVNTIELQLKKGIVERVFEPWSGASIKNYYLSHHPIVTPSNNTSKVRIVCEAMIACTENQLLYQTYSMWSIVEASNLPYRNHS